MKKSGGYIWGILLILAGIVILLVRQNIIALSWGTLWPGVLILTSIMFHIQFFAAKDKNAGLLVPAGILLVYGCLFLYNAMTPQDVMAKLWPVFIIGPGFGLLEMKLFSGGKAGSWTPIIILFSVGAFFLIKGAISSEIALAVVLILAGGFIVLSALFSGVGKKQKKAEVYTKQNVENGETIDVEPLE